jgi:hypothetical protein
VTRASISGGRCKKPEKQRAVKEGHKGALEEKKKGRWGGGKERKKKTKRALVEGFGREGGRPCKSVVVLGRVHRKGGLCWFYNRYACFATFKGNEKRHLRVKGKKVRLCERSQKSGRVNGTPARTSHGSLDRPRFSIQEQKKKD